MDAKTEQALARLPELIEHSLDYSEFLTTGNIIKEENRNFVIKASCAERTPMVFWFGEIGLVFYCQGGATVGMDIVSKNFDASEYLGDAEKYLLERDEEMGVVQVPLFPFLDGQNAGFDGTREPWIERFALIYRELGEDFDGLAAVLIEFDNLVQFGFSAVNESHFTYLFNNQCLQLQEEAQTSTRHRVVEIRRVLSRKSNPYETLLWLVE